MPQARSSLLSYVDIDIDIDTYNEHYVVVVYEHPELEQLYLDFSINFYKHLDDDYVQYKFFDVRNIDICLPRCQEVQVLRSQ